MKDDRLEFHFPDAIAEVKGFAIFMMDTNGIIQTWNNGCELMKGFKAEDAIGQPLDMLFPDFLRKENLPEKERQFAKENGRYETESWRIKKNGDLFWAFVVLTRVLNEEGEHIGFIKVTQDLTDKKKYFEQLQRSNEDLRQFAHVVSHDLKEPVRKIKTFNNRVIDDFGSTLPEKVQMYLTKMGASADRMMSLIEGVLSYSQYDKVDNSFYPVDLNEVLRSIELDLEVLIEKKRATITISQLPTITASKISIYQLFYNLILNALKFSKAEEPSRISITYEYEKQKEGEFVNIIVSDNGIGFDQEYANNIFDPFTRLNPQEEYEGTGLGLALCKKIVERHKGSILTKSQPGAGATFTIMLPI